MTSDPSSLSLSLSRACPECRLPSEFVIPSVYWVEDQGDKDHLIELFKSGVRYCFWFRPLLSLCHGAVVLMFSCPAARRPVSTSTRVGARVRLDPSVCTCTPSLTGPNQNQTGPGSSSAPRGTSGWVPPITSSLQVVLLAFLLTFGVCVCVCVVHEQCAALGLHRGERAALNSAPPLHQR